MRFNVAQLLREPTGSTREYSIDETPAPMEYVTVQGVKGRVCFVNASKSIWVKGDLEGEVLAICSRCLSEFTQPVHIRLDDEFFPTVDILTDQPVEKIDGDSFTIDESHVLDLSEAVRQYSIAATPMKPLCSSLCRGICATCGTNLNDAPCQCPTSKDDPRWGALFSLVSHTSGKRRS